MGATGINEHPVLESIIRAESADQDLPASTTNVSFKVCFSEPVQNVDIRDFVLTGDLATGAQISDISTADQQTYTVTEASGIWQLPAPEGTFNVVGVVAPIDPEPPYHEGYFLVPRFQDDFRTVVSTQMPDWEAEVRVFPQPAHNFLQIELPAHSGRIYLYNATGQIVRQLQTEGGQNRLEVQKLKSGTYHLRIELADEFVSRMITIE